MGNTGSEEGKVSIDVFALSENKWVKLAARFAWPLVVVGAGYIGTKLALYEQRIVSVEDLVAEVQITQTVRAADNERFQKEMLDFKSASIQADKDTTDALVSQGKDISLMTGILQQMQQQRQARFP